MICGTTNEDTAAAMRLGWEDKKEVERGSKDTDRLERGVSHAIRKDFERRKLVGRVAARYPSTPLLLYTDVGA